MVLLCHLQTQSVSTITITQQEHQEDQALSTAVTYLHAPSRRVIMMTSPSETGLGAANTSTAHLHVSAGFGESSRTLFVSSAEGLRPQEAFLT